MATPLANNEAGVRGQQAPTGRGLDLPPEPPAFRGRVLVDRGRPADPPSGSPYPVPEPRPAVYEVPAFTWARDWGGWVLDWFTGAHGVVRRFGVPRQQNAGGMNAWDQQRRTLRSAPEDAWDAGTAVGRRL